jgi:uncharacterized protein YcfL
MKKVLFVAAFALALASCRNQAQNAEAVEVDSTEVVVDSTAVEAVEAPAVEVTEEVAQ